VGRCGRHSVAMTTLHHHQLDQLRIEWTSVSRSPASRRAAKEIAARSKPLAGRLIYDLRDIIALLEPASPLSQRERSQVVADLLLAVPQDPLYARTLLQTLLPGIVSVERKLRWGAGSDTDPSAFLADLITACYELMMEWGGQERPFAAPDLLNALRCRMRRRMMAERQSLDATFDETTTELLNDVRSDGPSACDEIGSLILANRANLDPVGATALYGKEVLGMTYRELATMTGLSPKRLAGASRDVARRILE